MQRRLDKEALIQIALGDGKQLDGELTLNIGCGQDQWGDIRVDFTPLAEAANVIADLNSALPFSDEIFSKALLRGVIEHMIDPGKLIKEVHRVLLENGEIEILTDNAAFPVVYFKGQRHSGGYKGRIKNDRHYMVFHPSHLEALLEVIGFDDITVVHERYVDIEGPTGKVTNLMEHIGQFLSKINAPIYISQYFWPMIRVKAKKTNSKVVMP